MRKLTWVLVAALVLVSGCETRQSQVGQKPGGKPGEKGAEAIAPQQVTTISMKYLRKLEGHAKDVENLAFSSDSKTLISAAPRDAVRVWDPREGKQTASYDIKSESAVDVATLPGGRIALLLHSGGGMGPGPAEEGEEKTRIVIWNPKEPDKTREVEDNKIDFTWKASRVRLTCSRDGKYVATFCYVDDEDGIRVWNAEDLKQVKTFAWPVGPRDERSRTTPPDRDGRDVLFSPDGSHIFVRTQAAFHRWKAGAFDSLATSEIPSTVNAAMIFSADGKKLAYLVDYARAGIIALPEGKAAKDIKCFAGPRAFGFDASGTYLFYGADKGKLFAWNLEADCLAAAIDLAASMPEGTLPPDSSEQWDFFALSPDGRMLAARIGKAVCLWSVDYVKKSPVEVKWPKEAGQAVCGKCGKPLNRLAMQCPGCESALDWSGVPDKSDGPEAPMRNMFFGTLYRNSAWINASVTEKDAQAFHDQWPEEKGCEVEAEEVELFKKLQMEVSKKNDDRAEIVLKNFPGQAQDIVIPALKKDGKWKLSLLESEFFRNRLEQGKGVKAKVAVMNLAQAAERYYMDHGQYPDAASAGELVKKLEKAGIIAQGSFKLNEKGEFIDPWGNPYVFKRINEYEYRLYSCGSNGKDDSSEGDDVTNDR
jgi:WD40 repeat protein